MFFKIIFAIMFGLGLVAIVYYFVMFGNVQTEPVQTQVDNYSFPIVTSEEASVRQPGTILSVKPGVIISDTPILSNTKTTKIDKDFYELTDNPDVFGVYYSAEGGNLTVVLYNEDIKQARLTAEKYILGTLPYTKEQLCSLVVHVSTNEFVNPKWSGMNLGFSFCPGAIEL